MTTSVKENSAGGGEGGSSSKQHYTEREDDDGEDMLVVNSMRSSNLSAERGNSAGSKGDAPADSKTSPAVVAAMAQLGNSPSPTDPETEVMRADEKFGPAGSTSRSAQAAALASRTGGNTNQSYEHINSASGAVAGAASQSSVAVGAGAKAGSSIDNGRSLDTVGASMGSMSLGGVSGPAPGKASMGVGLKPLGGGGGRPLQALPHHIPKMDSLSNRMDDIRRNMGEEVRLYFLTCFSKLILDYPFMLAQGLKAPWDSKGKPLGSISSPLGKESKK